VGYSPKKESRLPDQTPPDFLCVECHKSVDQAKQLTDIRMPTKAVAAHATTVGWGFRMFWLAICWISSVVVNQDERRYDQRPKTYNHRGGSGFSHQRAACRSTKQPTANKAAEAPQPALKRLPRRLRSM
jgi:hypothetical protein